jgi:hypothetical protein
MLRHLLQSDGRHPVTHAFLDYLIIHKTTVIVSLGVAYVLTAGTQPPLGSHPPAGYWRTWAYNLFQSGAANFRDRFHPTVYVDPSTTRTTSLESTSSTQPDATIVKGK